MRRALTYADVCRRMLTYATSFSWELAGLLPYLTVKMVLSYHSVFLSCSFPVFHVPSLRLYAECWVSFCILFIVQRLSFVYFRNPVKYLQIFPVFQIPVPETVPYPIPVQYAMIHHDISPFLEAYVRANLPRPMSP